MSRPSLRDLVSRYGGYVYANGSRALIPGPAHSKTDLSLSIWENPDGRVIFHTFAGDSRESIFRYLGFESTPEDTLTPRERNKARRERQAALAADKARKVRFCRAIWEQAVPLAGTAAETYLREDRSIPIRSFPPILRFNPETPRNYDASHKAAAMVALVQDELGHGCGLHVTYISRQGGHNGRCMFGAVRGGSVRLHEASDELAVAEGLENALSYSCMFERPAWALLSTSQFVTFNPPGVVDQLWVAADADDKKGAGLIMAGKMRDRLSLAKPRLKVEIDAPPVGLDWNRHHRNLQGLT